MPVLVIGGSGFIGPRLIRRLAARGNTPVVCMDLNPGAASFAELADRVTVIRGDVTRFEDVMRAVIEVKPDRLINLAYGIGAGEGNPHRGLRLDILGMDNCFEAARLAGVKRVVYASSIAVSGPQRHFGERLVT
jgi:nucleoside-diphosphate-sugar epimerase